MPCQLAHAKTQNLSVWDINLAIQAPGSKNWEVLYFVLRWLKQDFPILEILQSPQSRVLAGFIRQRDISGTHSFQQPETRLKHFKIKNKSLWSFLDHCSLILLEYHSNYSLFHFTRLGGVYLGQAKNFARPSFLRLGWPSFRASEKLRETSLKCSMLKSTKEHYS